MITETCLTHGPGHKPATNEEEQGIINTKPTHCTPSCSLSVPSVASMARMAPPHPITTDETNDEADDVSEDHLEMTTTCLSVGKESFLKNDGSNNSHLTCFTIREEVR